MMGSSGFGDLHDMIVVDLSVGISGAYCAKLFTDAGASVTRVEPAEGDPLRFWRWPTGTHTSSAEGRRGDAPMFRYLRHGQRSVVLSDDISARSHLEQMCASADLVITSGTAVEPHEGTVVVSITPYGSQGPCADRPATEFTIQAESGALLIRGTAEFPPVQMGGRSVEWVAGAYAAVGALAAVRGARSSGHGECVDVSMLEVANLTATTFADLFHSLHGRPELDPTVPSRSVEIPSIEPTLDGWVGFNTNTREQWENFCILIERPDLLESAEFAMLGARVARAGEWNALVRDWTTKHETAEIVERAAALRIPVAPVSDGRTVTELEHARERGVFISDPLGEFLMPGRPFTIDGEPTPTPGSAPALGADSAAEIPVRRPRPQPTGVAPLPLTGLTVVDLTAWWAGPSAAATFAALGADVIHVESTRRMDGMRTAGGMFYGRDQWWEYSAFFLAANTNKRGITVDLDRAEGRSMLLELVEHADIVIENFTPRVLENFGLDWDVIHATNPKAIMVRMPAFGLTGPWRDRPGFAQTMEQITGLAWMTGHLEDQPRIQRGPCDPNGGLHAVFATLVALERRDRTGEGCFVEAPMFDAALAIAAEPVLESSAHSVMVERMGNRGPTAVPQNLYPAAGAEQWVAIACETDAQWRSLCEVMELHEELAESSLSTIDRRRIHQDRLDERIGQWVGAREAEAVAGALRVVGVPAAVAADHRLASFHEQMIARGFFETIDHPVVGAHPIPTMPFRYASVQRWLRTAAPTIGQHNAEILGTLLGHDAEELATLETSGVIGTRPQGV
jgi:crotonobetainyl-CoA:carnitine CoA-transferase CaiB-like acyl-CoA transferase